MSGRIALAALLLLVLGAACSPERDTDVHWERAQDLILEEEVLAGPEGPDYGKEVWREVIEELSQVHSRFQRREEALALMEEIKDARAAAFRTEAERMAREEQEREARKQALEEAIRRLEDPFQAGGADGAARGSHDLVFEELSSERGNGWFVIAGSIRNTSGRSLSNAILIADLYDRGNRMVRTVQGMLEPTDVPPGGKARFRVQTADSTTLRSFEVRFRELAGSELSVAPYEEPSAPAPGSP